jgi:hypothetical protein
MEWNVFISLSFLSFGLMSEGEIDAAASAAAFALSEWTGRTQRELLQKQCTHSNKQSYHM